MIGKAKDALIRHSEPVLRDWIDYNGHMNVAYYVLAFDHATDAALEAMGIGAAYAQVTGKSIFVGDMHVAFRQEVHEGDMLRFESRLLDYDQKRAHLFHTMFCGKSPDPAATNEIMCIHVDLKTRRPVPMPADRLEVIEALWQSQKGLEMPDGVGRVIKSLR